MSYRYQITISDQANSILEGLEKAGIYGRTVPDIIKRFVDARLAEFVAPPKKYTAKEHSNG